MENKKDYIDIVTKSQHNQSSSKFLILSKISSWATGLCAVHCILMPIIIAILPLVGMYFIIPGAFEKIVLLISLLLNAISLCYGVKLHKKINLILVSLIGFAILFGSHYFFGHSHNEVYHLASVAIGTAFVLSSNFINNKLCNSCNKCKH